MTCHSRESGNPEACRRKRRAAAPARGPCNDCRRWVPAFAGMTILFAAAHCFIPSYPDHFHARDRLLAPVGLGGAADGVARALLQCFFVAALRIVTPERLL